MRAGSQQEIDRRNREFWDELCGTSLARSLGIAEVSPDSLARFDAAYLAVYPYLARYVVAADLRGKSALEIGLGYGTLGQVLADQAGFYVGVDIAPGPVAMMRYRLGGRARRRALQASALDLPFPEGTFDFVCTIGCLHVTGDVPQAVSELHRVLAPGGRALVMLYHRYAFRLLCLAPGAYVRDLVTRGAGRVGAREATRRMYDANSKGEAAPHTEFLSRREVRSLFRAFDRVRIETQNFDGYALFRGRLVVPRERLLSTLGRVLGLDLYIVATK